MTTLERKEKVAASWESFTVGLDMFMFIVFMTLDGLSVIYYVSS